MAIIKYSPLVNELRGSVGNGTFQRSVAGSILRNKPVPSSLISQQITDVRSAMPAVTFAWRNLSPEQQLNWKNFLYYSPDFMRKSPKTLLSGYSLFVKYNTLRLLRGLTILSDIIFSQVTQMNAVITILSDSSNLYMETTAPIDSTTWFLQMQLSRSSGSKYSRQLKYLRIIDHVNSHPESVPFTAGYVKAWGYVPVPFQYIGVRYTFFHASMPYIFSPSVKMLQIDEY